MSAPKSHVPIGLWIKKADEALTAAINEAQQGSGLSRIEWQVLNVLAEGGVVTLAALSEALRPFADAVTLAQVVQTLVERGSVERVVAEDPSYQLSEAGARLHGQAMAVQKEVRRKAIDGVSEQEYETAVRVLQKIVENLGT